jgi:hypothetical protein
MQAIPIAVTVPGLVFVMVLIAVPIPISIPGIQAYMVLYAVPIPIIVPVTIHLLITVARAATTFTGVGLSGHGRER